ncbi:MAG: murein biosynthesis integral membrane protein MurJ [Chitinivibrionales bacterium]|nr:murein biosynthesis integral membrane protein MurJ [Chitinivibrionales bacterium]MBD3396594.1 murein biosynthesis integral membrane protein MurJ [Chitinivibrionales bacterium]
MGPAHLRHPSHTALPIMPDHDHHQTGSGLGKALSIAVAIMAASNVLSKLLALLRMRVLAATGGVGANVDAYAFSFLVPELLNHFLAAGMLSITFIPLFQKHYFKGDRERAWYFFSNLMTVGTILCGACITLGMVFAEDIIRLLAGANINSPDNPAQRILTTRLTRIILPAQLCFFWGALLMGIQYSQKRFLVPSLAGVVYNTGIILGGTLLAPRIGIEGFSWGVLAGALGGNVIIQIAGAARAGMRYRPVFNLRDPDLRRYILLTVPLILALNMAFANEFLFRFFGSRIPGGEGAIASLEYSWRIMYMIVSIFGQSLAAGFYPFVSHLVAENRLDEVHELLRSALIKIGGALMPLAGIGAVLSPCLVTVLLRVGRFDTRSVAATAGPLSFYLLGTFFFAATPLINRICYARHNTILPLAVSTGAVLVCLPLYVVASRLWGANGIALSSSVCMLLQFFLVFFSYSAVYRNARAAATMKSLGAVVCIAAAGTAVCLGIARILPNAGLPVSSSVARCVIVGGVSGIPALVLCLVLLQITRLLDTRSLVRSLFCRISGRPPA